MAESLRKNILKILAARNEPTDIQIIVEETGATLKSISEALSRLSKEEMVKNTERGFWQIEANGKQELEEIKAQELASKKLSATIATISEEEDEKEKERGKGRKKEIILAEKTIATVPS